MFYGYWEADRIQIDPPVRWSRAPVSCAQVEERLAIAGSGAIACGLAAVAALDGDVVVLARSQESVVRARDSITGLRARLGAEPGAGSVLVTTDAGRISDATYLVEAVAEDQSAKTAVLRMLAATSAPDAVIASTTSSLSIEGLAQACAVPTRFAGLHVFNPVTRMELVEVAFPAQASDDTRRRTVQLCHALGKRAVVVPDIPGFVVNRLLFPYLFEAVELMAQSGMAAEDVDRCMTLGAGHPMGPLELLDFVGLDVALAIGDAISTPAPGPLRDLVAAGALGRKSGRGFYGYDDEPQAGKHR